VQTVLNIYILVNNTTALYVMLVIIESTRKHLKYQLMINKDVLKLEQFSGEVSLKSGNLKTVRSCFIVYLILT